MKKMKFFYLISISQSLCGLFPPVKPLWTPSLKPVTKPCASEP